MKASLLCALSVLGWSAGAAAVDLTAQQAPGFVGKTATVCGTVVTTSYSVRTKGQPTFLNLDLAYPNQVFTVVIWGIDRPKFGAPELEYRGRRLCATGLIQAYRGKAEIVATSPDQLQLR